MTRYENQPAWLTEVLSLTARGPLRAPPESVLVRARAILPREAALAPRPRLGWGVVELLFDSLFQPALAGVRGAAAGARRLYRLDDADLDVEIEPDLEDPTAWRITAQLLLSHRPPPADMLAILWAESSVRASAVGDALGVLTLEGISAGTYRLDIWLPGEERAFQIVPFDVPGGDA